jgi:branched-chain amino acid transport system ATP-binding protein
MQPHTLLRLGIGYLMQRRSVFPYLTVDQNIRLGGWIIQKDQEKLKMAVEDVYERFPKLKERKDLRAGSLSGGEQRMIELGRALMTKLKLLLVDEFSTGLSPKVFRELYAKLVDMSRNEGLSILAVDQNVMEIANVADYMHILKMGRNDAEGPADQFRGRLQEVTGDWLKA